MIPTLRNDLPANKHVILRLKATKILIIWMKKSFVNFTPVHDICHCLCLYLRFPKSRV